MPLDTFSELSLPRCGRKSRTQLHTLLSVAYRVPAPKPHPSSKKESLWAPVQTSSQVGTCGSQGTRGGLTWVQEQNPHIPLG